MIPGTSHLPSFEFSGPRRCKINFSLARPEEHSCVLLLASPPATSCPDHITSDLFLTRSVSPPFSDSLFREPFFDDPLFGVFFQVPVLFLFLICGDSSGPNPPFQTPPASLLEQKVDDESLPLSEWKFFQAPLFPSAFPLLASASFHSSTLSVVMESGTTSASAKTFFSPPFLLGVIYLSLPLPAPWDLNGSSFAWSPLGFLWTVF